MDRFSDFTDAPIREKIRTRVRIIKDVPRAPKPCPSGKTRHSTRKRALSSRNAVLRKGEADYIAVYKCPMCHDFHLTSSVQRKR